jgi:hypothetical protein
MATTKSTYQILTDAQELIRDRDRWTQGASARDANGNPVGAQNERACCWCGSGAIVRSGGGEPYVNGSLRADILDLLRGEPGIVHTNDEKGHGAVLALFDRLREKSLALEAVS